MTSGRISWRTAVVVTCLTVAIVLAALMLRDATGPGVDLRNGRSFIQDNLWTAEDGQYAVWVGSDGAPMIARRDAASSPWAVRDLSALPGNPLDAPTEQDQHRVYAVGVDGRGHVHVAGNMHGSPLRLIQSRHPGRIDEWDDGGVTEALASNTYPIFVRMGDGTLLLFRRIGRAGAADIVLDARGPTATSWEHVGVVVTGLATDEGPYLHRVVVDERDVIHLLIEWRDGSSASTNSDVSYARSADGGRTWSTAAGAAIATPVTHRSADPVLELPRGSGLVNGGGLTVDGSGRPHGVVTIADDGRRLVHVWHDGRSWRQEDIAAASSLDGRPALLTGPDGRLWLLGADGTELRLVPLDGGRGGRTITTVPRGWEATFDGEALRRTGVLHTLVPTGDTPVVHTVPL